MLIPLLKSARFHSTRRCFWKWINTIFNKVDHQRIKDVGADQAAAEWLLRCGASVKWEDEDKWTTDYNKLSEICDKKHMISEIDATDSCIMSIGFYYLEGLKNLKRIRLLRCAYLDDKCMQKLSVVKNSLQDLEVISCGNISDVGVCALSDLKLLKNLYLYDLPEVKNREQCISELKLKLPYCKIDFPLVEESVKYIIYAEDKGMTLKLWTKLLKEDPMEMEPKCLGESQNVLVNDKVDLSSIEKIWSNTQHGVITYVIKFGTFYHETLQLKVCA